MASRLAAWLVTGPVGHLVAGTIDAARLLSRVAGDRLRVAAGRRRRGR